MKQKRKHKKKKKIVKKQRKINKQNCPNCNSLSTVWLNQKTTLRWCRDCKLEYDDNHFKH